MPVGEVEIGNYDKKYFQSIDKTNRFSSYQNEIKTLIKYLELSRFSKILDIGCGTASPTYLIKKSTNSEVTGTDFEDFRLKTLKTKIPFVKSYSEELPFVENSFDAVVSIHSFAHFTNPLKSLNEIYRILKPGGCFGLITPNNDYNRCFKLFNKMEVIKYTKDPTVMNPQDQRSLSNLLKESDFNNFQIDFLGDVPNFMRYTDFFLNMFKKYNIKKRIISRMWKDNK